MDVITRVLFFHSIKLSDSTMLMTVCTKVLNTGEAQWWTVPGSASHAAADLEQRPVSVQMTNIDVLKCARTDRAAVK